MRSKRKISEFKKISELGRGNFGEVFLVEDAEDECKRKYAIKMLNKDTIIKDKMLVRYFRTEVAIMRKIKHPNILHCYEKLEDNKYYYLVLDYCEGGDIEKHVKTHGKMNLKVALRLLKQMIAGFAELRKHSVIHRDFKPANVFLHNDNVVIGDFGFAKSGAELTTTNVGTPLYTAPEILNSDGTKNYDNGTDLWSLGVTFYFMLAGKIPWQINSIGDLLNKVKTQSGANLPIPEGDNFPEPIKYLLRKMITENPNHRISWKELTEYPLMFIVDEIDSPTDHMLGNAKAFFAGESGKETYNLKLDDTYISGNEEISDDEFDFSESFEKDDKDMSMRGLNYPSAIKSAHPKPSQPKGPQLKTQSSQLLASKMDEQAAIARGMLYTERELRYLLGIVPRSSETLWIAIGQLNMLFQKLVLLKIEEAVCFGLQESAEDDEKQNVCEKILEELHQMTEELTGQMDNLRLQLIEAQAQVGDFETSAIQLSMGNTYSQGTIKDNLTRSLDGDIFMVYMILAESGQKSGVTSAIKRALARLEGERRRERSIDGENMLPEGSDTPMADLLTIVDKQIYKVNNY